MEQKKQLRIADLAQETGLTESEVVKRLRRNGVEIDRDHRISADESEKLQDILSREDDGAVLQAHAGAKDELAVSEREGRTLNSEDSANSVVEPRHEDESLTISDVVEAWFSEHPEPENDKVAGRTYDEFARDCYLFLLANASKKGIPSTLIAIGDEERQEIVDFLDRAKAKRDKRRLEEARQRAEEQRRLEEARQRLEEQRRAEEQRLEEQRRLKIFSKHQRIVEDLGVSLQRRQCTLPDYYASVLRDRIERSAELLFGDASNPRYGFLKNNPKLLRKFKEFSFGDDKHPQNYKDPYVIAYYALRYELSYAFEYAQIYGLLLDIERNENGSSPFDVLSFGSGQGIDYWGLRYALSKRGAENLQIGWHGVDLETWPDHILEDGVAQYSDNTDVCDFIRGESSLRAKVLMFPKVISELPNDVIDDIASWLIDVTFTQDVHYLCFAHTERRSLNPADYMHKGADDCFDLVAESSLDAAKSAKLILAARVNAKKQHYACQEGRYLPHTMWVHSYDAEWVGRNRKSYRGSFPYLAYVADKGRDKYIWEEENDDTFMMDEGLRDAVKGIGSSCCSMFIQKENQDNESQSTDCDVEHARCNNPNSCPLYKFPRYRTGRIAYQIVRLVKQPTSQDSPLSQRPPYWELDEDIPF